MPGGLGWGEAQGPGAGSVIIHGAPLKTFVGLWVEAGASGLCTHREVPSSWECDQLWALSAHQTNVLLWNISLPAGRTLPRPLCEDKWAGPWGAAVRAQGQLPLWV